MIATLLVICTLNLQARDTLKKEDNTVTIVLSAQSASVKEVLESLETQTNFRFFYNHKVTNNSEKITMTLDHVPVETALRELGEKANLVFKIRGNQIVVKKRKEAPVISMFQREEYFLSKEDVDRVMASSKEGTIINEISVSGQVLDEASKPLPGVNILVKGTVIGTTTDSNGQFTLSVPNGDAVLVFSFIGYATQEVAVGSQSTINISLVPDVYSLGEIVVTGYGTQKRSSLVGAVGSVQSKDIVIAPVPSLEAAIQGRVAGVQVTNNGAPGMTPIVRIRGINSINNASNPLYVVDGMIDVGNFNIFESKDIESVEVLKDASAAAIYGSRAAAGVILITTKKGSNDNAVHVGLDAYYGFQTAWKKQDLLNTDQYQSYGTALMTNAGAALPPQFSQMNNPIFAGSTQTFAETNTDWQDEMFRTAPISQTTATITAGNDKSKFYGSIGYFDQQGIMKGSEFRRYTARFNSEHQITKKITIGQTLLLGTSDQLIEQQTGGRTMVQNMQRMTPYITVHNPNNIGGYNGNTAADGSDPQNPVRAANQDLTELSTQRFLGTLYASYNILPFLTYKFNLGIDYSYSKQFTYNPIYNEGFNARNPASLNEQRSTYYSPIVTNQVTFDKNFGKHYLNVAGIIEYQTKTTDQTTIQGNAADNTITKIRPGLSNQSFTGNTNEFAIISYIGRLNYEFAGKYILSASIRRDGASLWADAKKWGNFPSVGLGWRINEESFMKGMSNISELKLRGSYGEFGFIPSQIGYYPSQPVVSANATAILGAPALGSFYNALPNKDLTWEITSMTNVGVDLGLFSNRVSFSGEYFYRYTDNLILNVDPATSAGFSSGTPGNVGKMKNTGTEFVIGYRAAEKEFKWNASANFTFLSNKVEGMATPTGTLDAGANADFGGQNITRTEAGHPVQSFFGWQTNGLFQSDGEAAVQAGAKAGDIRFADVNGDGAIDANDRVYLGSFLPDVSYGINLSATYKGFDFSAFFQGVSGNKIYNGVKVTNQGMLRLFNASTDVLNAWTPSNTNTEVPRAVNGDPNGNARTSDRFLEDGSYFRLKNLTIGYSIPQAVLTKLTANTLSKFRLYFTGQNLITITNYTGYDPEIGARNSTALTQGIDYGQFPQARTIIFGLQASF